MLTFRADDEQAAALRQWTERLGVDRSTSELVLTPDADGVPTECVAGFDNLHPLRRRVFRRRITSLSSARMAQACRVLRDATGC